MKVLVLMSTYNGDRYLREQIDSILHQEGVEVSLLIRDDGSKDQTSDILKDYQSRYPTICIELGENKGCTESFRWLLIAAYDKIEAFDYFAFCDQDDVWLPNKLDVACRKLAREGLMKPCMYCSNLRVVDSQLRTINMKWKTAEPFITKGQSLVCSMATGCTMVFNKTVIETFHKYPPKKMHIHDLWIMHMCMFLGKIHYDSESYILYRQHGNNVIGAKTTLSARLRSKWKSIHHLFDQHQNEQEAKELLSTYGTLLSEDDLKLIKTVANYKDCLRNRFKLLMCLGKECSQVNRKEGNFWLKMRIILGIV
jgi:glycosyltransferase involved in cell wall biosynthesis